ncbi:MAG: hypothetical protein JW730_07630 [Anaerolineales bacterium]|nr:hypothetical protein [Anaerolineales bacterium]
MFTLRCLVDNNALVHSFRAEHGLAFAIATSAGQILFDMGQSGDVLLHNATRLGTWEDPKWQPLLGPVMANEVTRKAYDER